MGTVVLITLLLITRFHVSKMDADIEERRRDRISRREKRWSMNSQRLEQIVAELMRPIGDLRRSFDTDLSALLEEYLTEAGLHALESGGASPGSPGPAGAVAPNFPELALLLQQSACIYGRKVDFLYQHVIEVSESLQHSTNELSQSATEGGTPDTPATPGGTTRRARRGSGSGAAAAEGWARIALAGNAAAARREPPHRPPPTLPRMYVELEPRVLAERDAPLADYAGETIGMLQDFHVTWRLHGGLLVDDLELGCEAAGGTGLRAIPLSELQAAIAAAAPPDPPPDTDPDPADDDRLAASTPLPAGEPPPPPPPPLPPPPPPPPPALEEARALRRKRKADTDLYEDGAGKMFITADLLAWLREPREFCVPEPWVAQVVATRRARLLAVRRRLALEPPLTEFRGFDEVDKFDLLDMGGFLGWSGVECSDTPTHTAEQLSRLSRLAGMAGGDSDDDGFFEASDHGSEAERQDSKLTPPPPPPPPPPEPHQHPLPSVEPSPEWVSWRSGVAARAAAGEARGLDVRALGRAVLDALPDVSGPTGTEEATPFADVLSAAATDDADVSRLFLATLFLANAGNVEVVPGPALSTAGFGLRVASRDERLYCAAADTDPAFLDR